MPKNSWSDKEWELFLALPLNIKQQICIELLTGKDWRKTLMTWSSTSSAWTPAIARLTAEVMA